jgi:peptidoglycan hydrolase-like protein with peptidoglycan-binding domain
MRRAYDHLHRAIASTPVQRAATKDAITVAQGQLMTHGFDPGATHGELDRGTRVAIVRFQKARGLPPTGILDAPTNTALHAKPSGWGTGTSRKRASQLEVPEGVHGAIPHSGAK